MQAIQTRYLGLTNSRGARIKAWCAARSLTIPFPYEMSTEDAHLHAAQTLADKLEWAGHYYGTLRQGCLPNGDYCHVLVKD